MNADLDAALRQLAAQPAHPGLLAMEDRVLARVGTARRDNRTSYMAGVAAAIGAIALGVVGAGPAVQPSSAANALSPFAPSNPLAPSTLLASAE